MLRSPEAVVEEMLAEASYAELVDQRAEWMEFVEDFENDDILDEEWEIDPRPDVLYQWSLECLGLLCKGMAEKYNREYVRTGKKLDLAEENL